MIAIASRVFDIWTNAASKPIANCNATTIDSLTPTTSPERAIHPAITTIQVLNENVSTGLLPSRSGRGPRNHKLLRPPKYAVEVTSKIRPSDKPAALRKKATVNAVMPPYATDHPTRLTKSFLNGA